MFCTLALQITTNTSAEMSDFHSAASSSSAFQSSLIESMNKIKLKHTDKVQVHGTGHCHTILLLFMYGSAQPEQPARWPC